ncbi:MAG: gamma-glutamyl-phosphate reductase, partial [Betaproteobacteria bacterium]|nr:gamma-glutamyl-phosphate reductase [Betaproteobacteria bacterium]
MATDLDVKEYMQGLGRAARAAARLVARADTATKNRALQAIAAEIRRQAPDLIAENRRDVERAKAEGRDGAFVD